MSFKCKKCGSSRLEGIAHNVTQVTRIFGITVYGVTSDGKPDAEAEEGDSDCDDMADEYYCCVDCGEKLYDDAGALLDFDGLVALIGEPGERESDDDDDEPEYRVTTCAQCGEQVNVPPDGTPYHVIWDEEGNWSMDADHDADPLDEDEDGEDDDSE